jgi:hypothetical protein
VTRQINIDYSAIVINELLAVRVANVSVGVVPRYSFSGFACAIITINTPIVRRCYPFVFVAMFYHCRSYMVSAFLDTVGQHFLLLF